MQLKTDLAEIKTLAESKLQENDLFIEHLKQMDEQVLDTLVYAINEQIAPQINCLDCGNCCKSLMINVEDKEANEIAAFLQIARDEFDEKYVEKGGSGYMIMNTIPCHFLQADNCCSVYEKRFEGCREFPALHLPQFNKRLFTVFMHYDRCPIIFNVVEKLKTIPV